MIKPSILVEQRLRNNKFSLKENKHVNNKNFGSKSKPEDNKKSNTKKSSKPEDSEKPRTKKRSSESKLEGHRRSLSKLKNQ